VTILPVPLRDNAQILGTEHILTNVLFVEGKNFNLVENFIFMCPVESSREWEMKNELQKRALSTFAFDLWSLGSW
jgi:hypothetical protein